MKETIQNSNWHVLYTKPRHEIKALERLAQNGFEVYCPMKTKLKQWSDRKKTRNPSFRPLGIKLYILARQTGNC